MATIDALAAALTAYTEGAFTTAEAVEFVNTARRTLQRSHDWRPMQVSVQLDVPTTGRLPLPADFLHEFALYPLDGNGAPGLPLTRLTRVSGVAGATLDVDPVHRQVAALSRAAAAAGYYVWGDTLVILPAPSAVTPLLMDYARFLPDLAAGQTPAQQDEFTTRYLDLVRAGALAEAYDFLHEEERATRWLGIFERKAEKSQHADESPGALAGTKPLKRGN